MEDSAGDFSSSSCKELSAISEFSQAVASLLFTSREESSMKNGWEPDQMWEADGMEAPLRRRTGMNWCPHYLWPEAAPVCLEGHLLGGCAPKSRGEVPRGLPCPALPHQRRDLGLKKSAVRKWGAGGGGGGSGTQPAKCLSQGRGKPVSAQRCLGAAAQGVKGGQRGPPAPPLPLQRSLCAQPALRASRTVGSGAKGLFSWPKPAPIWNKRGPTDRKP